ncbi:enoyl-CoA hydratase [Pigmentiphaga litoralis]|jgi:enoyl-CoA hydratase/carnithine racemase|uniref:crotonase/enoyl-CoA hydratase family protein n=1 Tax=Pigmentiphaga litoralis TaxID=516702 RepID=UPI0016750DD9|nr:crotonase/enoyl-CoA hydratase family protein [Pigmentiphaga litoralis]GGX07777.1 enoyl-CoA hydratase [Pigmentiphaga litoralis]
MTDNTPHALVRQQIDDDIAILTLNRPAKRNAISLPVISALRSAFENLPASVRVVILNGEGDHFSAGLDLSELTASTPSESMMHSHQWYAAFRQIQFGRVPVISVLHGAVVGGGLELAATTHVRVVEESGYFGLPEGQRGIFVGGGGSVRISKLIGFSRVAEMMLTGRVYSAAEGVQLGLAHYLTPAGDGMRKARELARRIASNAPLSNFAILNALPLIAEQPMEHGLMTESLMAAMTQGDDEAKQRVAAFLDKRAAKVVPT